MGHRAGLNVFEQKKIFYIIWTFHGDQIQQNFFGLAGASAGWMDSFVTEATDIGLHNNDCNRDGSFTLSRVWYPVTDVLTTQEVR
jgi:hypothetical protein